MIRARSLLVCALLGLAVCANAQFPGLQMPSLWYNPVVVMDPGAQKDLHLTQAQVNKIQGVIMQEGMKLMSLAGGAAGAQTKNPGDLMKALPQIMDAYKKMQKACTDNLNPTQLARLHQLTLQLLGPTALTDSKVRSALGLTDAQTKRFQEATARIGASSLKALGSGAGGGMANAPALAGRNRQAAQAALDAILTPKQKAKWKAMQGKPLHMMMSGLMGG